MASTSRGPQLLVSEDNALLDMIVAVERPGNALTVASAAGMHNSLIYRRLQRDNKEHMWQSFWVVWRDYRPEFNDIWHTAYEYACKAVNEESTESDFHGQLFYTVMQICHEFLNISNAARELWAKAGITLQKWGEAQGRPQSRMNSYDALRPDAQRVTVTDLAESIAVSASQHDSTVVCSLAYGLGKWSKEVQDFLEKKSDLQVDQSSAARAEMLALAKHVREFDTPKESISVAMGGSPIGGSVDVSIPQSSRINTELQKKGVEILQTDAPRLTLQSFHRDDVLQPAFLNGLPHIALAHNTDSNVLEVYQMSDQNGYGLIELATYHRNVRLRHIPEYYNARWVTYTIEKQTDGKLELKEEVTAKHAGGFVWPRRRSRTESVIKMQDTDTERQLRDALKKLGRFGGDWHILKHGQLGSSSKGYRAASLTYAIAALCGWFQPTSDRKAAGWIRFKEAALQGGQLHVAHCSLGAHTLPSKGKMLKPIHVYACDTSDFWTREFVWG